MHEGLTYLRRGGDINLCVGNMKELSKPREINDVH